MHSRKLKFTDYKPSKKNQSMSVVVAFEKLPMAGKPSPFAGITQAEDARRADLQPETWYTKSPLTMFIGFD
jgi:hypothetical protein